MKSFQDPKLWVSLIATLAALGILELSESEQAALVQAIVALVGGIGYVVSVAIAQAQRAQPQIMSQAPRPRSILTDLWQESTLMTADAHNASMHASVEPLSSQLERLIDAHVALTKRVGVIERRLDDCEADS